MDDIEKGGEDLVELLGILRCRVAMIVTVAGLSLCLALVLLVVIPPRYTATTAILLDPMSNNGLRIGGGEFLPLLSISSRSRASRRSSNRAIFSIRS